MTARLKLAASSLAERTAAGYEQTTPNLLAMGAGLGVGGVGVGHLARGTGELAANRFEDKSLQRELAKHTSILPGEPAAAGRKAIAPLSVSLPGSERVEQRIADTAAC